MFNIKMKVKQHQNVKSLWDIVEDLQHLNKLNKSTLERLLRAKKKKGSTSSKENIRSHY